MFKTSHIVTAVAFALVVAHDVTVQIKADYASKLALKAEKALKEELMVEYARVIYLCSVLEKHDVPADEFDEIALNFHKY
jgi:hypothetical protein